MCKCHPVCMYTVPPVCVVATPCGKYGILIQAEQIMEAIELYKEECLKMLEYKEECKAAGKKVRYIVTM